MKFLLAIIALLVPGAALAAGGDVSLNSEIFVERQQQDPAGAAKTVLEPVEKARVVPGDSLIFVLSYKNGSAEPATDFVVTNPLPSAVSYAGFDGQAPEVSIDGGKSWGNLSDLKVTEADGTERDAQPSDVTHVRWTFATAIPAGESGQLKFRGVVK